jgi:solute carrier family 10 (sodium/bile acid cotransporter), member 3/5
MCNIRIVSGSGASNQWTIIFDGDVNLSALMSFVSTAASFIMMPIYFYTLGRTYTDELAITVPFAGLARSLAFVVVPYSIGIGISYLSPKSRPFVKKLIKPVMISLLLFFLTFGIGANWYIFKMIDLYTALTAPLLPFLGFLFGGALAWMCRLSWSHIKTIGIEAGMQNTGIAFMIIMYSFPQPYATQAIIVPMVVSILTNKPFWLILIVRKQIRKYRKHQEEMQVNEENQSMNTVDVHRKDELVEQMQQL